MDNSKIMNRNNSASSDSTDIDLDEIAKMIDPLDDLEENLFSSKPRASTIRNSQKPSPKKGLPNGRKSLARKDAEEIEVLTSVSSSNGHTNKQIKDDNLGSWLKKSEIEKGQEITDVENSTIRVRKRAANIGLNEANSSERGKSNDDKIWTSSNLKTGLWGGDDLWSLGEDAGKTNMTTVRSPLISPVKSSRDIGAIGRSEAIKSPMKVTRDKSVIRDTVKGQTNHNRSAVTGNKKPGKFDWLGLIDDDIDDEKVKQLPLKNSDKVTSLEVTSGIMEEQSHERVDNIKESKNALFDDKMHGHGYDISRIGNEFSSLSREPESYKTISDVIDSQVRSHKGSKSEGLNVGIPRGELKSTELKNPRGRNVVVYEEDDVSATGKDFGEVKGFRHTGKDKELDSGGPLVKNKSLEKESFESSATQREDGQRKGLEVEKQNERALSKGGSVSEEHEGSSNHGYAPTFLAGPSENSGRRRRRREITEAKSVRGGLSTNFDPLGLFLMDDEDKIDTNTKEKTALPDWLVGTTKKSSGDQNEDSMLTRGESQVEKRKEESSSGDMGSMKKIPQEKSSNAMSNATNASTSKSLTDPKEISDKLLIANRNRKEIKNIESVDHFDALLEEETVEGQNNITQRPDNGELDEREVSQSSQNTTGQKHASPVKIVHEDGYRHTNTQLSIEDVYSNRNVAEQKMLTSEGRKSERTDINEERKEKMDDREGNKEIIRKVFPRGKAHHRVRKDELSDEDNDDSSTGVKNNVMSGSSQQVAIMERHYSRKIRDLEDKVSRVEYLEEELEKMRYFEGEVEHLRAVVHVLEMEKSAAESLVVSLQERHAEQIKRLEEVHRNEVETLNKALLREEKRGAEEVRRLAEDHRKTLDRLMEANVRLEEEFRNRMQEARRDWSRDVEAMRQAYQQSSSAAITNASLAVLTGHSFGVTDMKDKSESSKKDDLLSNSLSQCPEEVKELNQTVERVESILIQTLEAIIPKGKPQNGENVRHVRDYKGGGGGHHSGIIRKLHKPVRVKKRMTYRGHTLGKSRKDRGIPILGHKVRGRNAVMEEYGEETLESDENGERIVKSDRGAENATRYTLESENDHGVKHLGSECQSCSKCHFCIREHSLRRHFQSDFHASREKSDKEGRNMCEYSSRDNAYREHKFSVWDRGVNESSMRQMNDRIIREERDNPFSFSRSRLYDGNLVPPTYLPKQSEVIINPKAYLMKLAAGNINNLFQPSNIVLA